MISSRIFYFILYELTWIMDQLQIRINILQLIIQMKIFWIGILILISFTHQQDITDHKIIELDQSYSESLTSQSKFMAKYQININQDKVKKLQKAQWYLFVDVQPVQQLAWESTQIKLFVSDNETNFMPLKQCWSRSGVASCFVTSNAFNYTKSKIHAQVICRQACKYNISSQVSSVYPLTPNQKLSLDFEGAAYTKIFSFDTNSFGVFKMLEIILKPISFLSFNQPIRLYVNKGETIPTREKHDYSGIHLWDDGKGVFIDYPMALNKFTILVQGPEKNVLSLQANIIKEDSIVQAQINQPQFSYIQSQAVKTYKIKVDKNTKNCIKLTTISGAVQLKRILDQDKAQINQEFTPLSRTYGQLQYKLTPQFFKKQSKFQINQYVYVQIKGLKQSTFVFQFYYDNDLISHLIPEVNKYAELSSNDVDQYYIELVQLKQNSTNMKNSTIIEVMTTTFVDANLKTKFFICRRQKASLCDLNPTEILKLKQNKFLDSKQIQQLKSVTKDDSLEGVVYYALQLNYSSFKILDNDVMQLFIVVVLMNQGLEQTLYTLQYVDFGKTYFLKEKQSKKDRISIDQFKYYRYINNDPDVIQIKLHVVQISGQVLMQGFYEDPRASNQDGKQIYEYHNTLSFTKLNLSEIYVQMQGLENAYYSLYLQLIRKSQQNLKPDNNTGYNQLIILEDNQYQFLIKPKQKMIFQIHSKSMHYLMYLQALLPLDLCMTQNLQTPPFQPNCQVKLSVSKRQRMTIDMDRGKVGNMGVTNNNDKIVNFKLKISSEMQACQKKQLGKLYKYMPITEETNETETFVCARYKLDKIDSVQVVVQLLDMSYESTEIQIKINDKQKIQMLSPRHTIKKQQLQKICGKQAKCRLFVQVRSKKPTQVDLIVQYNHGQIQLVDGVGHPVKTTGDLQQPKHFIYTLYNKVNTTIMIQNIQGYYKFYGKIVDKKSFQINKQYPSAKDSQFSSANPFYFNYQVYVLTQTQIKNISCEECLLLISVYANQTYYSQMTAGRYVIQCTQQDRFLKENQPVMGYLQAKSVAFYQFYNSNQGTIFININNHNKNCSKIYAKKGNQARASASDYDKTSQQSSLIIDNAVAGPYAITIQAKNHCPYSIQVVSSKSKIAKLKKGIFSDLTLKANEQVSYLYQNYSNKTFKVFALNKIGELFMQIKKIESSQLDSVLKELQNNNTIAYDLMNMDTLRIDKESTYFCVNCTYFINILAQKYTETSIVIPTDNIQIPINQDSFIKDIVKVNQSSIFRIFTESIAQFQIYVQYGKINVTITQNTDNKVVLSKIYQPTKEPQYEKFQIQKDQSYDYLRYSIVNITGIQNSYYSFSLVSSKDKQERGNNVKPGIPQYFFLQKNIIKCFRGTLQDSSQQFIISFETGITQSIKKTNITCKINNKTVQFKQTLGVNQLILQIVNAKELGSKSYELCLISNDEPTSLTFIQSSRIIYLPQSTSIYAHHPFNFTFGPRGKSILQVDQCKQRVKTLLSPQFNSQGSLKSQISQIRKSNNIIEFEYYGPVYMHVQTTGARIRWRPKDQFNDIGVGYDKFTSGRASAYKDQSQTQLVLKINPIKKIQDFNKNTSVTIINIQYFIYFAKNQSQLNAAMNCQEGQFLTYSYKANLDNSDKPFQYKVNITTLKQKFSGERYFLTGVIANLNVEVNKIIQTYRFIYPFVDIQREVLMTQQQIKEESNQESFFASFMSFLSIATFVLVIAILLFFCYRNILSKCLKKKRGRLSDQGTQNFKYTQFASMD